MLELKGGNHWFCFLWGSAPPLQCINTIVSDPTVINCKADRNLYDALAWTPVYHRSPDFTELLSVYLEAYLRENKITWFQKISLSLKIHLKCELQCESVCYQGGLYLPSPFPDGKLLFLFSILPFTANNGLLASVSGALPWELNWAPAIREQGLFIFCMYCG